MSKQSGRLKWNDEAGNFCVMVRKGRKWEFKTPLEPLSLKEVPDESRAEILQMIYYNKYDAIDDNIGRSKSYDVKLAKKLKCW